MIDDDDFIVDPETGVLDLTQPKTPQKPKRKQPVSSVSCKKKLKMWLRTHIQLLRISDNVIKFRFFGTLYDNYFFGDNGH